MGIIFQRTANVITSRVKVVGLIVVWLPVTVYAISDLCISAS